ncbi:RsmB/NOP family class I SAM-dependent RNA methyltransferase [Aureimonas frigidaquae]|uniref:SAM-dependent MTase RsmB/NOP-type domain-containing protein n=1 Tax=Aureimonas frigidaquae TaxID=424757 RepID=A0A0P0Z0F7_9HYPH|nr:hypothetical protein [Aureimonas frigidaquae]
MGLSAPAGKRSRSTQPRSVDPLEAETRPGLPARQVAARLLSAVLASRTSLDALTDRQNGHPDFRRLDPRDQALVKAILATALKRHGTLDAILAERIDKPLPGNAGLLRNILHVGMAQILFLDVPDSAAVDLAVTHANLDPRTRRFAALVNAVLRRVSRERDACLAASRPRLIDMPDWMVERLLPHYGRERLERMAQAHLNAAPLDLSAREDPEGWADRLGARLLPTGTLRLRPGTAGTVAALPGFEDGAWWVQDAAARLPARLFGPVEGLAIADLCAAPGGKTAQLAAAGAHVTAVELSPNRMRRLQENLDRLKLPVTTLSGDLRRLSFAAPFDGVLLDAPCSSTGTIRRHPDVPYVKSAEEVDKLAAVQADLLAHAAGLVRSGGRLVFSNCSIDPAEGEGVVDAFLAAHDDFQREPVRSDEVPGLEEAIAQNGDLRTTPDMLPDADAGLAGLDGFYAARLIKRGNAREG